MARQATRDAVQRSCTVDAALDGQRLDKALVALLPEWGLRARRRLWEAGSGEQVLVNGKPCAPGYFVVLGDCVELRAVEETGTQTDGDPDLESGERAGAQADGRKADTAHPGGSLRVQDSPRFLEARHGLLFFHKPAGLHSVSLPGGRGGASLEDCLASLVPAGMNTPALHLLNRLDCGTSGLVVAAADADAAVRWHEAEDAGQCRKTYVTLLMGTLTESLTVTRALDTHHRRVTRVLRVKKQGQALAQALGQEPSAYDPAQDAPPLRHTALEPVLTLRAGDVAALMPCVPADFDADQPLTLALCRIRKGVRHQIRAHAAYAGFPLWGDVRYGGGGEEGSKDEDGHFVLHHGMLESPYGVIFDAVPWLAALPEKIANNIAQSLEMNKFLS